MVFAYRAGYDVDSVRNWLNAQEDMLSDVHPSWIDYLLTHPLPSNLYYDLHEWEKRVPKVFDRSDTS
jgi:predicted Zn-dependent protease